jgi:hypothetical protein
MKSDAGVIRWMRAALMALPALFFLAGCGGSGTIVAGGGTGGTGISAGVITGFGSVIVNDVQFDVSGAVITLNDNTASEGNLRLGMFVKIRGTFNPDGLTGVADLLDSDNEVLGAISNIGPDTFTVLGQEIIVESQTVFDRISPPDLTGLRQDDIVEVYGIRNGNDIIRATRVEKKSSGEGEISVKGTVTNFIGGNTFNIGALFVTSTVTLPVGFGNGVFVEVKGIPTGPDSFTATRIELEDEEDTEFNPEEGEEVEVEGFVSNFSVHPGVFKVGLQDVQTTAATNFEGGTSADLADGVRVEAEGVLAGGFLVAEDIKFR